MYGRRLVQARNFKSEGIKELTIGERKLIKKWHLNTLYCTDLLPLQGMLYNITQEYERISRVMVFFSVSRNEIPAVCDLYNRELIYFGITLCTANTNNLKYRYCEY
jgi:hypothetical protein